MSNPPPKPSPADGRAAPTGHGPEGYDALCEGVRRRLVNHRLARRLNVNQAAKLAGLSRTGLERMESGDVQPSLESLHRLALAYGEGLASFLAGVEEEIGVARGERARLEGKAFDKETKRHEHERLLLEISVSLGLSEWLDEWKALAAIAAADADVAENVRGVIRALVSRKGT